VDATDLGSLSDAEDEIFVVNGYISPSSDVDIYRFYISDGYFDWFNIEAHLTGVPEDADYALELIFATPDDEDETGGSVDEADDGGLGEGESIDYGGDTSDEGGWYEIVVYSKEGLGCSTPYTLTLDGGAWR
jgi:hypothetical protein